MKKHFLFLSLMMALVISVLLPQAAHALTYTVIAGTTGAATTEGPAKLLDGQTSTKWCTNMKNGATCYILFKTSDSIRVSGYTITTANDNASCPGRNPKNWVLAASNDSVNWDTIHVVTNESTMQNVNYTPFTFLLPTSTSKHYRFFRWTITAVQGNDCFQASEFSFIIACDHPTGSLTYHPATTATCTTDGHSEHWTCNLCGKVLTDTISKTETSLDSLVVDHAHGHTFVDGICSICGASASPYASVISNNVPGATFSSVGDSVNGKLYDWAITSDAAYGKYMPGIMSTNKNVNSSTSQTTMTLVSPRPFVISFDYYVSAESYDKISVLLDSATVVNPIGGRTGGTFVSSVLPAGKHQLTAKFCKDGSSHENYDRGFLYNISFDTVATSAITAVPHDHGSFTLSHDTATFGDTIRITGLTYDAAYRFNKFETTPSATWLNDSTFLMPNAPVSVALVLYEKHKVSLVTTDNATATLNLTEAYYGDTIRIQGLRVTNPAYKFRQTLFSISVNKINDTTFLMLDQDVTATLNFYEQKKITLVPVNGVEVTLSDTLAFCNDTIHIHTILPDGYKTTRPLVRKSSITWFNDSTFRMVDDNITVVPNVLPVHEVTYDNPLFEGFEGIPADDNLTVNNTSFGQVSFGEHVMLGLRSTTSNLTPYRGKACGMIWWNYETRIFAPVKLQAGKRYIFSMRARLNSGSASNSKIYVDLRDKLTTTSNSSSNYTQQLVNNVQVSAGGYQLITDTFTCDSAATNQWLSIYTSLNYSGSRLMIDNVKLEEWPDDAYPVLCSNDSVDFNKTMARPGDTIFISAGVEGAHFFDYRGITVKAPLDIIDQCSFIMPAEKVVIIPRLESYVNMTFTSAFGDFTASKRYPQAGDTITVHIPAKYAVAGKESTNTITWINDTTLIVPSNHTTVTFNLLEIKDIAESPLFEGFENNMTRSNSLAPVHGWWTSKQSGNDFYLNFYGYTNCYRLPVSGRGNVYIYPSTNASNTLYKPVYLKAGVTYACSYFACTSYNNNSYNFRLQTVVASAPDYTKNDSLGPSRYVEMKNHTQIADTFSVSKDSVYWVGIRYSAQSANSSYYTSIDNISLSVYGTHTITLNNEGCSSIWASAASAHVGDTVLVRGMADAGRIDCGWHCSDGVQWLSDSTFLMPNYDVTIQRATIVPAEPTAAQPVVESFEDATDHEIGFRDNMIIYTSNKGFKTLVHRRYADDVLNQYPAYDGNNYLVNSYDDYYANLYAFRPVKLRAGVSYSFSVMTASAGSLSSSYSYKGSLRLYSAPNKDASFVTLAEKNVFSSTYERIEGSYKFSTDTLVYLTIMSSSPSTSHQIMYDDLRAEVASSSSITCISTDSCMLSTVGAITTAIAGDTIHLNAQVAAGMTACVLQMTTSYGTTEIPYAGYFVMPNTSVSLRVMCKKWFAVTADSALVDTFRVAVDDKYVSTLTDNWYTPDYGKGDWHSVYTTYMYLGVAPYRYSSSYAWMFRPVKLKAGKSYNFDVDYGLSYGSGTYVNIYVADAPSSTAGMTQLCSDYKSEGYIIYTANGTYNCKSDTTVWIAIYSYNGSSVYVTRVQVTEVPLLHIAVDSTTFQSVDIPATANCGDTIYFQNPVYADGIFANYTITYHNGEKKRFTDSCFVMPGYDVVLHANLTPVSVVTASAPFYNGFEGDSLSSDLNAEHGWQVITNYSSGLTRSKSRPYEGAMSARVRYSTNHYIFHPVQLQAGKTYRFSMHAVDDYGNLNVRAFLQSQLATSTSGGVLPYTIVGKEYAEYSGVFTAPSSDTLWLGIYMVKGWDGGYGYIDNISLIEYEKHSISVTSNVAGAVTASTDSLHVDETFDLSVADGYYIDSIVANTTYKRNGMTFTMPNADLQLTVYVSHHYRITFLDNDSTVLAVDSVSEGIVPTAPAVPVHPRTETVTYKFAGWSPSLTAAIGDATYTAVYDTLTNYIVSFYNYDGTLLKTDTVGETLMPQAPEEPAREATVGYTYSFAGWSPTLAAVTGNANYTALYDSTAVVYEITYLNYDGSLIDKDSVAYDAMPQAPAATRARTAEYTYTFKGWDPELAIVSGDAVYTAQYDSLPNFFVTFLNYDSTTLKVDTVASGMDAVAPEVPAREGYRFTGWSGGFTNVTAHLTVIALFEEEQTGIRNDEADRQRPVKMIEDDRVIILMPDGKKYDTTGRRIR